MIVNGGPVLYIGNDFRDGFVWVNEWTDGFECHVICDNYEKAAEYLKTFSDDRFHVIFYTLDDDETIAAALAKYKIEVTAVDRVYQNVYCNEPFDPKAPEGILMRELKYEDADLLDRFNAKRNRKLPMINGLKAVMRQRDVLGGEDCIEFCFGMFRDDEMIAISIASLQSAHGFTVNNCIYSYFLDGCAREDLYVYAYKYVTDWALSKGALPFDDIQTPHTPENKRNGAFNSSDLGYKLAICACGLKYRVK